MRSIKSYFLLIFLTAIIFIFGLVLNNSAYAQESGNSSINIQVNHVAGFFEKIAEKLQLFLKFNNQDKVSYHQNLTEKRLAELKFVINSESYTDKDYLLEDTTSRYTSYLGVLTDFIINNHLNEKRKDMTALFDRHRKILEGLRDHFPVESGWWLLLDQDVAATKIYSDKLNNT
ncbi:MAG: hypothetical protein HYW45_00580 [Candidatus Daviesbacteria bacterium]|nr:MAG: hypothetical protein HYW45_00580 [Candidatus Daviesbacteria bacterium]